jgi:hypothetical protein
MTKEDIERILDYRTMIELDIDDEINLKGDYT